MMTAKTRKITVAEFWAMPEEPGYRYELVDGEPVDMDGAPPHGRVTLKIGRLLGDHVDGAGLPLDVGVSTGFQMDSYTLRIPDVHVTTWERMAAYDESAGGWPQFAPNVAIEVASPSNAPADLERKTDEYFTNGAQAVWIIDPGPRTVVLRRPGRPEQIFGVGDVLRGDPEIPGFVCSVDDIFSVLDRMALPITEEN